MADQDKALAPLTPSGSSSGTKTHRVRSGTKGESPEARLTRALRADAERMLRGIMANIDHASGFQINSPTLSLGEADRQIAELLRALDSPLDKETSYG